MSKCVASEEDTLPDINTEEFTGAQRNEEDIGDQRKDFTGTHLTGTHVTGTLNDNKKEFFTDDDWIVMGAPSFTGAHEYGEVTGAPQENILQVTSVTGADSFTGAQYSVTGAQKENITVTGAPFTGANWNDVRKTPDRISKARRRLSLSLRKSRAPENSVEVDDGKKLTEYIIVDSSPSPLNTPSPTPSIEVLSDIEEPGLPIPSRYVFIPLGTKIRRRLAPIFGINQMGPLPNYSGILRLCEGHPSRVKEIEGNGNCLFNSMSYVLSSSEKFNWKIQQELCEYIEENWKKVGHLGGVLNKYKSGEHYV